MHLLSALLALVAGGCLALGLLVGSRVWRRTRRAFVAWAPGQRAWLRGLGLTEAVDFLGLPGVVVGGHAGRRVLRVRLGGGAAAVTAYLKVELAVGWRVR